MKLWIITSISKLYFFNVKFKVQSLASYVCTLYKIKFDYTLAVYFSCTLPFWSLDLHKFINLCLKSSHIFPKGTCESGVWTGVGVSWMNGMFRWPVQSYLQGWQACNSDCGAQVRVTPFLGHSWGSTAKTGLWASFLVLPFGIYMFLLKFQCWSA